MPSWSPDDKEIALASAREDGQSVWAVNVATEGERKGSERRRPRRCAVVGPKGEVAYHVTTGSGRGAGAADRKARTTRIAGRTITGSENVFAFRASWTPSGFLLRLRRQIRRRNAEGRQPQTIEFSATMQVTRAAAAYARRKRDFTSTVPRQVLRRPCGRSSRPTVTRSRSPRSAYLRDAGGGKPVNITRMRRSNIDPAWRPTERSSRTRRQGQRAPPALIRDMKTGQSRASRT